MSPPILAWSIVIQWVPKSMPCGRKRCVLFKSFSCIGEHEAVHVDGLLRGSFERNGFLIYCLTRIRVVDVDVVCGHMAYTCKPPVAGEIKSLPFTGTLDMFPSTGNPCMIVIVF